MHFEALVDSIARKTFLWTQRKDHILSGIADVDVSFVGVLTRPAAAVLQAPGGESHVVPVDAGTWKDLDLGLVEVVRLDVLVRQARREGDIVAIGIFVDYEVQGAGHVVRPKAYSTPRVAALDTQREGEVVRISFRRGKGEGESLIVGHKDGLGSVVVFCESWSESWKKSVKDTNYTPWSRASQVELYEPAAAARAKLRKSMMSLDSVASHEGCKARWEDEEKGASRRSVNGAQRKQLKESTVADANVELQ
jgi:hypothetical protein